MSYLVKNLLDEVLEQVRELANSLNVKLYVPQIDHDGSVIVEGNQEEHAYFFGACFSSAIQCAYINSLVYMAYYRYNQKLRIDINFRSILNSNGFVNEMLDKLSTMQPDNLEFKHSLNTDNSLTISTLFSIMEHQLLDD